MFQVLPANPDANNVRLVTSNGLKPELMFKYIGIVYYQLTGYVDNDGNYLDNNGVYVYPNAQEKLLEAFKPDNEKRFHFVEYCEPVTKVYANTLRELYEKADRFVQDDGLPYDFKLQSIKRTIPKKHKHERN
jgi:hypothetical protein